MKLCTKCKHLHNDEDAVCSNCNSPLESITDENTPVYLLSAEGFELERVKTALEDNSIPCDSVIKDKQLKKQEFINKNSAESDILVPYAAIKEDDTQVLEDAVEQKDSNEPTLDEKFEEMSGVKRTTVRVLSAIAFLALVALAVYGTDFITGFIKGLFG